MRLVRILLISLACFLAMTQRLLADDLLIFSADWCGHCKTLKADLQKDPSIVDGYTWGYVDADKEKELARQYGVKSLPTIIVIGDDNKEVKRQVGYKGPANLRKWLRELKRDRKGVSYDAKAINYTGNMVYGIRFRSRWNH